MLNEDVYENDGGIDDIVRAKLLNDPVALTEASLSRITKHVPDGHFGIITSWRGGIDHSTPGAKEARKEKHAHFKAFRLAVERAAYLYNRLVGSAKEDGSTAPVREHSLFISGNGKLTKEQMHRWASSPKHPQDEYIYSGPETGHHVQSVKTATGEVKDLGKYHPGKLGRYHSELLGSLPKGFTFESWQCIPELSVCALQSYHLSERDVRQELGLPPLEPGVKSISAKLLLLHEDF